ncbi:MAG TPA: efflux RND transporter permease subunit [Sulfuricurvum sp.]|nr:efflux RND transporter permease subunit [Sulfuricurvum sp.]
MYQKFETYLLNVLATPQKKKKILWGTLAAFLIAVALIPTKIVLAKMLPGKNSDTYSIYLDLPTGSSIQQTAQISECVTRILQKESQVIDTEVFLGSGSPLDFAGLIKGSHFKNNENVAEIVVNLTKKHHREEPSYTMVQRLRPVIVTQCESLIPQTSIKFTEPPAGPPTMASVVAEVYGENTDGIRRLSQQVKAIFQKTEGLVDIDIMSDEIVDKFEIRVNTDKITQSGLSVQQVNDVLYMAFEGMPIAVKNSQKASEQIPIYLTLHPEEKKFASRSQEAIGMKLASLSLMNSMGLMVPITEVIDIVPVKSNPMIMTKDLRQMNNVVAETDMVSQVYPLMDARTQILDQLSDDYEITKTGLFDLELVDKKSHERYELKWDGEMKVTLDTFVDLGGAFIAALVLIFLLMVIYYKSFALSGIVLLGSFLSIIGVIIGHWIMNLFTSDTFFLTATSLIGFIALIGISSRNSLLLIDFTKSLMIDKGMEKKEAIAYASATRAKPIFLTAAAIILASTLLASDAVFGGLGVSLIFGTIAAVIASLIVVPVLIDNIDLEKHFDFHPKNSVPLLEP